MDITPPDRALAHLELELLDIDAQTIEPGALYARLRSLKLPPEVAIRLETLTDITRKVGGKVIAVGKIIVLHLLAFIESHPNMLVGMALGAALSTLVTAVPVLGHLVAPLALALGVVVGGVIGHRVDQGGRDVSGNLMGTALNIAQDAMDIAKEFFKLLIGLFLAVSDELIAGERA